MCVLREEGSFPVRSFVLHEGVRFPLGVASAGTAIMAFLPDDEQEALLARWEEHARGFSAGHSAAVVRGSLQQTRLKGYSVNPGLVLEGSTPGHRLVHEPAAGSAGPEVGLEFAGELRVHGLCDFQVLWGVAVILAIWPVGMPLR